MPRRYLVDGDRLRSGYNTFAGFPPEYPLAGIGPDVARAIAYSTDEATRVRARPARPIPPEEDVLVDGDPRWDGDVAPPRPTLRRVEGEWDDDDERWDGLRTAPEVARVYEPVRRSYADVDAIRRAAAEGRMGGARGSGPRPRRSFVRSRDGVPVETADALLARLRAEAETRLAG